MTLYEAAQQALDALESTGLEDMDGCERYAKVIADLRIALKCPPCNNNCNQGRDCPARKK